MLKSQIIKFIFIGIINTIFNYLLYSLFIFLGFDYRVAVLFATIIGVLFSFKTFSKYVFSDNNKKFLYKFILIYVILYIVNITLITVLQSFVDNLYISGFLATICCAVLSFILNKWYVFKK